MPKAKVLLIRSTEFGWAGLRSTLKGLQDVEVIGEVRTGDQSVEAATALQPDLILAASTLDGAALVPLLQALRDCCPACKIVLIGELLDQEEIVALAQIGVLNVLPWKALSPETLPTLLTVVLETGVMEESVVVAQLLEIASSQLGSSESSVTLKEKELAVLQGMAAGLTQPQIAATEHLSVRSERRIVSMLEEQFEARSLFELGVKVEREGLIP